MLPTIKTTVKGKISTSNGITLKSLSIAMITVYFAICYNNITQAADIAWYQHFKTDISTHLSGASTTSGASAIGFIPKPYTVASSNTYGVLRVSANEGGSFALQNPGIDGFGVNSELKVLLSSGIVPTKFSNYSYNPSKTFYMKYSIRWNGETGEQYFTIGGAGLSYSNNSLPTDSEIFTGIKVTYGTDNTLTLELKDGASWTTLGSVTLTQNTSYIMEIFGNNSNSLSNYNYGSNVTTCGAQSVASGKYDLYINGALVGDDLTKGGMNANSSIFNFQFYGLNSPDNSAAFYLDDIIWSNYIPSASLTPYYQPTSLTITDTTSTSYKVNFTQADCSPTGYLVLRKSGSAPTNDPVDFTSYEIGNVIGNDTVVYTGPSTTLDLTSLGSSLEYYYKIYSYYGEGSCRNYYITSPLEGSASTFDDENVAAYRSKKSGLWTDPTSWDYEYRNGKYKSASKKPTKKCKSVIIKQSHKITASNLETPQLSVEAGAELEITGDLTVSDGAKKQDFRNEGTLVITGNMSLLGSMNNREGSIVKFSGSGSQNIPDGTYQALEISTGGEKTLAGDVVVKGSLNLNNASINTGSFILTLDSSASLTGENATNYVKGRLKITKKVKRKKDTFNNIGVTIDATANNQNLGAVTIIRSIGAPVFVSTSSSISRNWSIEPENQPTQNVELTLQWNASDESQPFDLNYMQVWKSTDNGYNWFSLGDLQPAFSRSITVNTSSFSDWTVSDFNNVLPNNFKYFTGKEKANSAMLLNWAAEKKTGSEGFVVEKSITGRNFEGIGLVKPHNNTSNLPYEFTDKGFISGAYYRVKQIGQNSKADIYSPIIFIAKEEQATKLFSIYPNPVGSSAKIELLSKDDVGKEIDLAIFSNDGKEVFRKTSSLNDINSSLSETIGTWERGTYISEIKINGKSDQLKILKK